MGKFRVKSGTSERITTAENVLFENTGIRLPYVTITSNYTATIADFLIRCDATGGVITITLPDATTCGGLLLNIKKIDASVNRVIIDGDASQTIDGQLTQNLPLQYENLTVMSNGTNWDIL
jgi:hypothetical protein